MYPHYGQTCLNVASLQWDESAWVGLRRKKLKKRSKAFTKPRIVATDQDKKQLKALLIFLSANARRGFQVEAAQLIVQSSDADPVDASLLPFQCIEEHAKSINTMEDLVHQLVKYTRLTA